MFGGSGVEEKSSDDEITLTNYIPESIPKRLSLDLLSQKIVQLLDLLSHKIVQVSFIINSIICTFVEIAVEISGIFFR